VVLTILSGLDKPASYVVRWLVMINNSDLLSLPNLPAGKPFGTAAGDEVVVAVANVGCFMDPRSCTEYWEIQPGYTGDCPHHEGTARE
jgi:hypothetical protein